MNKTKHLKKNVETTLTTINVIMISLLVMIDDFVVSWSSILFFAIWISIIGVNTHILTKYGRNM